MSERFIVKGPPVTVPIFARSTGVHLYKRIKHFSESRQNAFLDVASNKQISYKDLFDKSCKLAVTLKTLGFSGQTIAVCSENSCEFFIPVLAALYLGSPIATINHGYTRRELVHACDLVKPKFVFCSKATFSTFKALKHEGQLKYIKQMFTLESIDRLIARSNISNFAPEEVNPKEHLAALLFSSGTTGMPKGVMITHHNLNVVHSSFFDPKHLLSKINNSLLILPFYHGYGFNIALASLLKGTTVKFMCKFEERCFLGAIETFKIDYLTLVPPLMVFLAKHPLVDNYNLTSVKIIVSAAATCSKELEDAVLKRLNNIPNIYQGYGLTESTLSVISVPSGTVAKPGSVGKADAGVEVRVRKPETNENLGPLMVGEICVRGDMVMKGYYENSSATSDTISSDGWLLTGDLGYYDKDEYFFIVDRLKELIKFKGFQVPPAELESLLLCHPKISDAAVIGIPDETAGELPLAFVVRKPGMDLNEQEVKDYIKGQVSYAKQLHGGVKFIEAIPKSASGKILRKDLRASLLNKSKL